jgi:apolipoprotein N-acyltransferase
VIDAHGVVRQYAPMHQAGVLRGRVPPALPPTPFARLGNLLSLGWAALLCLVAVLAVRVRRQAAA